MSTKDKTSICADTLPHMQRADFQTFDWKSNNVVMLTNGKTYKVIRYDKESGRLLLHSDEFNANFWANFRITHKPILL